MAATTSSSASASAAYALYLHRAELQRRRTHYAKVSQTKIRLTNQLIDKLRQRMESCTYEDLQILVRETKFKRNLEEKLRHRQKQLKAIAKKSKQLKRLQ
ncbi:uncharacterized protein LOC108597942 [Drosophila busckii]|uniref:uncharacterized protein LOC108597942 n=1 Tax=Drosophila busckii TaxID=30019 RepID=UPI00083F0EEF|nr:uncharacterized protein LOC108597942 [Drosophila busckii]